MVENNSKFAVDNVSDDDAPYYVATEHNTSRVLSKGYDLKRVMSEANAATGGTTPTTPNSPLPVDLTPQVLESMRVAFEFGYKCAEKGMNIQAALIKFEHTMRG